MDFRKILEAYTESIKSQINGNETMQTVVSASCVAGVLGGRQIDDFRKVRVAPQMLSCVPYTIVFFTTYETIKKELGYGRKDPYTYSAIFVHMGAAAVGELAGIFISLPFHVGMTEWGYLTKRKGLGIAQVTNQIWKQHGFNGFYRHLVPRLIRDLPYSVMFFSMYEFFKWKCDAQNRKTKSGKSLETSTALVGFQCGSLAGFITGVLLTPLFTSEFMLSEKFAHKSHHAAWKEWQQEFLKKTKPKITKLYRGALWRGGCSFIIGGVILGGYEYIRTLL